MKAIQDLWKYLKRVAFCVARSAIPGYRTDDDKTMEETFMKQSKSHGGTSGEGFPQNYTKL